MLSTALLRFLHGERSGKQSQPPGWALSCSPLLPGSVLQPPPSPLPAPSQAIAAQDSPLALPITFPVGLPSIALGLWVHPPNPAGSIPTAGCWLAGPGQEASLLCSPQAEWHHPGVSPGALQLCSLSFVPTSSLAPQMLYRPKYCPLHRQGIIYHPVNPLPHLYLGWGCA